MKTTIALTGLLATLPLLTACQSTRAGPYGDHYGVPYGPGVHCHRNPDTHSGQLHRHGWKSCKPIVYDVINEEGAERK